jgi:C4-dicarboxylate-specific signal transduction histidine kinase
LQQVILNLIMNGIEAMSSVSDGSRQLLIKTQRDDSEQILISVTDSGIGLDPKHAERLLKRSFTTKTEGWAWGYRSAVLLLRLMAAACGRPRMPDRARHSSLPSQ